MKANKEKETKEVKVEEKVGAGDTNVRTEEANSIKTDPKAADTQDKNEDAAQRVEDTKTNTDAGTVQKKKPAGEAKALKENRINENNEVNVKDVSRSVTAPVTNTRRNIDDFTTDYQGQNYQVLATKDGKADYVVGYTNDASGGGMIELVDASPDMKGPLVVRLDADEKRELDKNLPKE